MFWKGKTLWYKIKEATFYAFLSLLKRFQSAIYKGYELGAIKYNYGHKILALGLPTLK